MVRLSRIAVLLFAGVALAGCGGDDQSASEEYADDVCSTLSTWVTDVEETVRSLTDAGLSITQEDVETAVEETRDATATLSDDLQELGAPETEDGGEAQDELESLSTTLEQQVDTVEEALASGGGVTAITATVTAAISTAASAVNQAYQDLQGLDPAGELGEAFEDSEDCDSLREQLDEMGSGSSDED